MVTELVRSGKAPATIGKAAHLVRGIFEEAVRERVIPRSPWTNIKLPTIDRIEARFLTVEQVECLADAIDGRYRTLVRTLAFTGLRFGGSCCPPRRGHRSPAAKDLGYPDHCRYGSDLIRAA